MIEKLREDPKPVFEKGMAVRLRGDLPEDIRNNFKDVIDSTTVLRILHVADTHTYGRVAWLGPLEMSQKNIEDFNPGTNYPSDPRYEDVFSIVTDNIIPVHN